MELELDTIACADCRDWLPKLPDNSVDACVTDAPYELAFMGKKWDASGIAYDADMWGEILRVLKPGGHLLSFGGTRTYHRMACAIEDAGFEIRNQIQWIFGQGFPKNHDISKAIDRAAGAEREVIGRKSDPRYKYDFPESSRPYQGKTDHDWQKNNGVSSMASITAPATDAAKQWNGWGTALKPANEPICVARKPLSEKTIAANVLKWGTGGLNIDGCRIGVEEVTINRFKDGMKPFGDGAGHEYEGVRSRGRWPANVIMDEDFIPTLCPKSTIRGRAGQIIRDYYADYKLPNVQRRFLDLSEQTQAGSGKILQSKMLLGVAKQKPKRHSTSDVREKAQSGIDREDAATAGEKRARQPSIQGEIYSKGLSLRQYPRIGVSGIPDGETDVAEGPTGNTGTSADSGNAVRPTIDIDRTCTSQKRDKGRQPTGKSGDANQHDAQNESQTNIKRASEAAQGKRNIEILACDIPSGWLKYFEPTGWELRNPNCAAQMLDQQSGQRPTGAVTPYQEHHVNASSYQMNRKKTYQKEADTGGASRFFYCAKASRKERNAGCENLKPSRGPVMSARCQTCGKGRMDGRRVGPCCDNPQYKKDPPRGLVYNYHPTVKPLKLMQYLCRLVTPPGGIVLDSFAGSGTTCIAALREGFHFLACEKELEYVEIAKARIKAAQNELPLFKKA